MHFAHLPCSEACRIDGTISEERTPIMAVATSISTNVNPDDFQTGCFVFFMGVVGCVWHLLV